jgi:hypothetical protein
VVSAPAEQTAMPRKKKDAPSPSKAPTWVPTKEELKEIAELDAAPGMTRLSGTTRFLLKWIKAAGAGEPDYGEIIDRTANDRLAAWYLSVLDDVRPLQRRAREKKSDETKPDEE